MPSSFSNFSSCRDELKLFWKSLCQFRNKLAPSPRLHRENLAPDILNISFDSVLETFRSIVFFNPAFVNFRKYKCHKCFWRCFLENWPIIENFEKKKSFVFIVALISKEARKVRESSNMYLTYSSRFCYHHKN